MVTQKSDAVTRNDGGPRPLVLLAGWVLLLAGAIGILHLLGRGPLATPPLTRPGDLAGWVNRRSPANLGFGLLRLGAMGLGWYLLATTLAGLVTRICGLARWSAALDAVSPAAIRRVLQGAAGLTVAATVTGTQSAWAVPGLPLAPGGQPTPIMRRLPAGPASERGAQAAARTTPTMRGGPAADGDGAPADAPSPPPTPASSAPAPFPPPPPAPAPSATWVIRPGDNLWSVAEAALARAWHRAPSDAEVDSYWKGLIAANRIRLANRDDPDLVFPGQVFLLPPTPG